MEKISKITINVFILTIVTVLTLDAGKFKKFSSIHDPIDSTIQSFLLQNKIEKSTYYYDESSHKDGIWNFYPFIKVSENIIIVQVSSFSGNINSYNYLIFVDTEKKIVITDTLGPFYDSYVDAISYKMKNNSLIKLLVRFANSEPNESRYTIKEFIKQNKKFIQISESARN